MKLIKTYKNPLNGNCFFACVSSFLDKKLKNCKRDDNHYPLSKIYKEKETSMCNNLRQLVCFKIESLKDEFKEPYHFDDEIYENIDDRIHNMKKNYTWVGMPEIKTLADMLNIVFKIYIKCNIVEEYNYDEDTIYDNLNLISVIGKLSKKKTVCNLLLENDHYELIDCKGEEDYCEEVTSYQFVNDLSKMKINNNTVKRIRLKKISTIDGILIKGFKKNDINLLKTYSLKNGIKCGFHINNYDSWFFWDNIEKIKEFCNKNDIEWI